MTDRIQREHRQDRVIERDVDLLLLEELHCNPDFAKWLVGNEVANLIGYGFIDAWNSVTTGLGESDLIALYDDTLSRWIDSTFEGSTIALMIENKVDAAFQPDQAARYRQRGEEGKESGAWDGYTTLLVAPSSYLATCPPDQIFECHVSYEAIADRLALADDKRSQWKAEVLRQAARGRIAHSRPIVPDEKVSLLMNGLIEFAVASGIRITMPKARKWNARSAAWYTFTKPGLPRRMTLDHRTVEGVVHLYVPHSSAGEVNARFGAIFPDGAWAEERGKSTMIFMKVPVIDLAGDVSDQGADYLEAVAKAVELRDWAVHNRKDLDTITVTS